MTPQPPVARRQIVGRERANWTKTLVRRYTAGDSIRRLAQDTGLSYGFVYRILIEGGVTFRQRGGFRPGHRIALARRAPTAASPTNHPTN